MKRLTALLLIPSIAAAADVELRLGGWSADNGQDDALVGGPELRVEGPCAWVASASALEGRFNSGGDVERLTDARLLAGRAWDHIDAGVGYAYLDIETDLQPGWEPSYPTELDERNADIHGPVVYVRSDVPLFHPKILLDGLLTWMPADFGDLDDLGYSGAFVDVRAGITLVVESVTLSTGYRGMFFRDVPDRIVNDETYDRDTMDGVYASVGLTW